MLALLAKNFFERKFFFAEGFLWSRHRLRRARSDVLDIFEAVHRMTLHQVNATRCRKGHANAALSHLDEHWRINRLGNFGGDDWRERQSATLVVAWMSPRFSSDLLTVCVAGFPAL